jgi:hypothetical protein
VISITILLQILSLHLKGLGPEIPAYQLSCYGPLIRTHIISGEKDQRHYRIQVTNSSTDTASKVGRTAKQPFQRPGRKMLIVGLDATTKVSRSENNYFTFIRILHTNN